ncbi:MAG TPA: hypothetical protein VIV55_11515 [Flavobacterium sp.]
MNIQKFIEQLFNIDSNTSATIIITVIVFALGYIFTSLGKIISKYSIRKANRKIFIKNLESLIISLNKRREVIEIQLIHLNIKTFTVVPISKIQFFQISILNSMTYKETFECFFTGFENILYSSKTSKLRSKCFIKVWENMSNIEFWENKMYEQMKPAQDEINRLNEILTKPLTEMRILYTELLSNVNNPAIKPLEKEFLIEVKSIINTWLTQENIDHGYTVNEFLSKKFISLSSKYEEIQSAKKLKEHSVLASYSYGNIVRVNESIQRSLKDYDTSMRYFIRTTKVLIKTLH